jgi:xylose dehydrogenase (NAD/NADP)
VTLRLGLLSTARINRAILAAASATNRVEVTAVASRDEARAKDYADEHGVPRSHGSYHALLADPEVDAVYVSLPNRLHHEWTMLSLAAGKHVLCEKPYSRRPADVEVGFDLAESSGHVLQEAFMYRHHPQTRVVADLIGTGAIGRPLLIQAEFSFELDSMDDVRADPDLDGGSLMDVGCYCISGTRLVAGEPTEVVGEQILGPTGIDMSFRGALHFSDGAVGQFACSFEAPRRQELRVIGESGTLTVEAPWRVDWGGRVLVERDVTVSEVDVPDADSYVRELENLADAVERRGEPLLGRDDAVGQARVIAALYRSVEAGASVPV